MKNILKVDRMHGYLIVTNGKLSCSDEKDEQYMPLIKYLALKGIANFATMEETANAHVILLMKKYLGAEVVQ